MCVIVADFMSDGFHGHPSRYTLPLSPPPPLSPSRPPPLSPSPSPHLPIGQTLPSHLLCGCIISGGAFFPPRVFNISRSTLSCILPTVMCLPLVSAPTPLHLHRILLVARPRHRVVSFLLFARDVTLFSLEDRCDHGHSDMLLSSACALLLFNTPCPLCVPLGVYVYYHVGRRVGSFE